MDAISCLEVVSMGGPWGCKAPYCPDECGERWEISTNTKTHTKYRVIFVHWYPLKSLSMENLG